MQDSRIVTLVVPHDMTMQEMELPHGTGAAKCKGWGEMAMQEVELPHCVGDAEGRERWLVYLMHPKCKTHAGSGNACALTMCELESVFASEWCKDIFLAAFLAS